MKSFNKVLILSALLGAGTVISVLFTNCSGMGFDIVEQSCSTDGGDPFIPYAWHLGNCGQKVFSSTAAKAGIDLNLRQTWSQGIYGSGILVRISDDGLQDTHEDLKDNFNYSNLSRDYTTSSPWVVASATVYPGDIHGTSVAGVIGAVGWNGIGSRGVAPKVSLTVANFLNSNKAYGVAEYYDQASGTFDIINQSWGATQNALVEADSTYESVLKATVTTNRDGKGAVIVKAAGNDFLVKCHNSDATCIGNSNFDGDNTNPYTILVAALNAMGDAASYSSAGANIWISGFGGENGSSSPGIVTTDRLGCSAGYAIITAKSTLSFEKGGQGNSSCNYTVTFDGTSAATPTVTGAVALLLDSNPSLTWRDVKYILAKTAVPMDYVTTGGIDHPLSVSLPSGYKWEQPWVVNKAGFAFHNWYGFGKIDVDGAVAMAKNYSSSLGTYTETNWENSSGAINVSIPDNSASGGVSSLTVASGSNVKIEAVRLKLSVTHSDISELAVELTSPSGTKSILVNMRNSLTGIANFANDVFLSNAFYQENSQGTWTLKVIDGKSGNSGTITGWSLDFTGGR
ncbi:MAG: S8 family peptidase [Bacillota bacterium]